MAVESVINGGVTYSIVPSVEGERVGFGIAVRTESFGGEEACVFEDISTDYAFIKKMLYALAEGLVTPYAACEVIDHYLCEYM